MIIGPKVIRGRVVSFSVRCMALVAAVPLRVARLDALYGDAEAEPPHREFGVIEEAVRAGERHASDYRPGEAVSRSWDGFVADLPLEGSGFEPSVPGDKPWVPSWEMVRVLQVPAGQAIPQYDAAGMLGSTLS